MVRFSELTLPQRGDDVETRRIVTIERRLVEALRRVSHPEFERDLAAPDMIRDAASQDSGTLITPALPFKQISIKDELVQAARTAVKSVDADLDFTADAVEMTQKQRSASITDAPPTVMQSIPLSGVVLVESSQDLFGRAVRKEARIVDHMGAPIMGLVEILASMAEQAVERLAGGDDDTAEADA